MTTPKAWTRLISKKLGVEEEIVRDVISEVNERMERALLNHQQLQLRVGMFDHVVIKEHKHRNVNTGKIETIPEHVRVRFRVGRLFRKKYSRSIDTSQNDMYDESTD